MSKAPRTPLTHIARENLSKTGRQLWQITKAFFKSERRGRARGLLGVLLLLSVAYVGVTVLTPPSRRRTFLPTGARWAAIWAPLSLRF